jgi:cyclopropane-fatty-acyl-phospholipid synthase
MTAEPITRRWPRFAAGIRPARGSKGRLAAFARRLVLARLEGIRVGRLDIVESGETATFGDRAPQAEPTARVIVHDPRCWAEIAFGGSIGAGEAYMRSLWDADDLTAALRVLLRNRAALDGLETGLARLAAPVQKALHRLNRNSRAGSRRNIAAHYDVGNEFFALWLDSSMMYSAAIFDRPDMSLEQASVAKLERICGKLELRAGDRVLEIGTGWGGFALHAARSYGCIVTTITVSREQHELAQARVQEAGLAERVQVLLADYRDLTPATHGRFDKVVSIEMIEAVGHEYLERFFSICSSMLEPHGMLLLQAITIADQRYEAARRSVDFIQRHIFPGSCLTSVTSMSAALTRATDLKIFDLEDIGPHYATTLAHWRQRFNERRAEIRALGYGEEFLRMWEYYFCYCEAGFLERAIGDVQMLLVKPDCRRPPLGRH